MKRHLLFVCLLAASVAAHAASWSDLWSTRDQQAQRLLESGKAADAAGKFEDGRRRGYAEIKAGQYADAAKHLESFEDPQSQYNRGNALARGGKLENALAAYDKAIKQAPADSALGRDARHNRELVAEQLKKQQSSQSKSDKQSQSDKSQSDKKDQSQKDEQNASNGSQQQKDQQGQGSQGDQSQQRQAGAQKPQDSQDKSASSQAEKEKQDAADAKRDAEASLAQSKQDANAQPKDQAQGQTARAGDQPKDQNGKPAAAAVEKPPSEQALALEQWLRQIPDDPSGLLRRKFLIEHMRRQQEAGR